MVDHKHLSAMLKGILTASRLRYWKYGRPGEGRGDGQGSSGVQV